MGKTKSVLVDCMDNCVVCGSPYVQVHHVFFGTANRKISDQYGYVVPLCQEHHTGQTGIHFKRDFDLAVKKQAQEHFEAHFGARNDFIRVFGKSYI